MTNISLLRNAFIVALISIAILLSRHWEETDTTTRSTVTRPSFDVIDHSTRSKEEDLDLLGVSVHHLANNFMDLVHQRKKKWWRSKHYNDTTIYEIENLHKLKRNGIIREKGRGVVTVPF